MASQDARPVWLLDVDGVLNAIRPDWGSAPREGTACYREHGFVMRWAPELTARVAALHDTAEVEIRWATTWVDEAEQIEALMGLPRLGLAFSGLPDSPQVATPGRKRAAALQVVETEGRPLIWTDDDAIPVAGPERERLEAAGPPALLIAPDPGRGLRPDDLLAIQEFIDHPSR